MDNINYIPRNKKLKQLARNLRNNSTKEENHLWYDFLKNSDIHFYRQYIIGDYIVDFYCPKAKLVIELDGSQHFEEEIILYDTKRTEFFECFGLEVIRFTNSDINKDFDNVCSAIFEEVERRLNFFDKL